MEIGKEEIKLSLYYQCHDCLHRKLQESTKKFLELVREFIKATGYKVDVQKTAIFLYISLKYWNLHVQKHTGKEIQL